MDANDTCHIGLFQEPVVQFGLLAMFGQSMPLTFLCIFACTVSDMFVRYNVMFRYTKRLEA